MGIEVGGGGVGAVFSAGVCYFPCKTHCLGSFPVLSGVVCP